MFHFRKKEPESYDKENFRPVVLVSICTGESAAGFRDIHTGKFREEQLIRNEHDLQNFMDRYGLTEPPLREY